MTKLAFRLLAPTLVLSSLGAAQAVDWHPWRPAEGQLQKRHFRLAAPGAESRETIYFLPSEVKQGERPPLVVALPGGLGIAATLVAEQPRLFVEAERHGFVVVVPSSTLAYRAALPSGRPLQDVHEEYVLDAIAEAEERYGTDPKRRFLIGFSAGGAGVWTLALRHPNAFRGLALIAPAGSPEREKLAALRHLPIYLAQAADDHAIRRGENRRAVEELRALGAAIVFEEPAHGSHGLQEYPVLRTAFDGFRRVANEKPRGIEWKRLPSSARRSERSPLGSAPTSSSLAAQRIAAATPRATRERTSWSLASSQP